MVLTLAPWADRDRTQNQIAQDINAAAQKVPALRGTAQQPNSLRIRGAGNGLSMAMVGSNYQALTESTQKLLLSMEETGMFDTPRFDNEPNQASFPSPSIANGHPISASTLPACRAPCSRFSKAAPSSTSL